MKNEENSTPIYIIVCKNSDGHIVIPSFTAFEEDEATNYYESECSEPDSPIYQCELIKILKAFELHEGCIVWANREPVGINEKPLYLTDDHGLRGRPFIYFNRLISNEEEINLDSLHVARVY